MPSMKAQDWHDLPPEELRHPVLEDAEWYRIMRDLKLGHQVSTFRISLDADADEALELVLDANHSVIFSHPGKREGAKN